MTNWSGIGVNYGHDITDSFYNITQVEADFAYLKSRGVTRIRIAMPGYDWGNSLGYCYDMVVRALADGFYVTWGLNAGSGITATTWAAYKSYVTGTLVPWAQSVGLSELSLGNEFELNVDGTTLTAATARADVRSMASSIKASGYTGKITYSTASQAAITSAWVSEGIGSLDTIGWNSYDTFSNFDAQNATIVSTWGAAAYVSEFGSLGSGFADYADENTAYVATVQRVNSLISNNVSRGYFFCYRDGGFGIPANSFALVKTDNTFHTAIDAVLFVQTNVKPKYDLRAFSATLVNRLKDVATRFRLSDTSTYKNLVFSDGAEVYLPLSDPSGVVASDLSTNGNNGVISATGVTLNQVGPTSLDPAMLFDGATGKINLPNTVPYGTWPGLTVECWVRFTSFANLWAYPRIASTGYQTGPFSGFELLVTEFATMQFNTGMGAFPLHSGGTLPVATNTWYHCVGTYDGNYTKLYINGILDPTNNFSSATQVAAGNAIAVGYSPTTNDAYINATISKIAIYPVALTQAQVTAHFQAGLNKPLYVERALGSTLFRQSSKDISTRFSLMTASVLKDTATRFRQRSLDQLKDAVTRFRLQSPSQIKDVVTRFRQMSSPVARDVSTRFRQLSQSVLKDARTRLRLMSAPQLKDASTRLRLQSANQLKDASTRFRIAWYKDVSARFRIKSADTLKDAVSRLRLMSASQFKDSKTRLRLQSAAQLKDITTRLRLASANQQLKDVTSRFRQRSADQLKDAAARLRLKSADQAKDIVSRVRVMSAAQFKDVSTRIRVMSALQLRDVSTRFKVAWYKDTASRLRLRSLDLFRDVATRLRMMSAPQNKDTASRFRQRSLDQLRDVKARIRLQSVLQFKDVPARLRLQSAAQLKDVVGRLWLVLGTNKKDIATRIRVRSANQLKDITTRLILALSNTSIRDIVTRLRLRSADQLKDTQTRTRVMSASQLKDTMGRLRLMSALDRNDVAARIRLRSTDQLKDIKARLRLIVTQQKDITARVRLMSAPDRNDTATRFWLVRGINLKDMTSRFRLRSANQVRDITARLQLTLAQLRVNDIVTRFRQISALQFRDIGTRLRVRSANQLKDIVGRLQLLSQPQVRDVTARYRLSSAWQSRDVTSRLRQRSANQLRDVTLRLVLALAQQRSKDVRTRMRIMSSPHRGDLASRLCLYERTPNADLRIRQGTARMRTRS